MTNLFVGRVRGITLVCHKCKRSLYFFIPIPPTNNGSIVLDHRLSNIIVNYSSSSSETVPPSAAHILPPVELVQYNEEFARADRPLLESARLAFFWARFLPWYYKLLCLVTCLVAILYFITDADLIPDSTPVIGYFDDIAFIVLAAVALAWIVNTAARRTATALVNLLPPPVP